MLWGSRPFIAVAQKTCASNNGGQSVLWTDRSRRGDTTGFNLGYDSSGPQQWVIPVRSSRRNGVRARRNPPSVRICIELVKVGSLIRYPICTMDPRSEPSDSDDVN